jgi:hypothetical protein
MDSDQCGLVDRDARWAASKFFLDWLDSLPQPEKKDRRAVSSKVIASKHKTRHQAAKALWKPDEWLE